MTTTPVADSGGRVDPHPGGPSATVHKRMNGGLYERTD